MAEMRECSRCRQPCIPVRGVRCRACVSEVNRQYSLANKEKLNAASKKWAAEHPERTLESRERWKEANKERSLAYRKAYTADRREEITSRLREWRRTYPERVAASKAVQRAVRNGVLKKTVCWVCGEQKVHGHHSSYAKDMVLLVVWLCRKHHQLAHSALTRPHHVLDSR